MHYTVADVQKRYGVTEGTVLAWIRAGELKALNVGQLKDILAGLEEQGAVENVEFELRAGNKALRKERGYRRLKSGHP